MHFLNYAFGVAARGVGGVLAMVLAMSSRPDL